MLVAGPQPERSNTNRFQYDQGYQRVAHYLKIISATDKDIPDFLPPWDAQTTARWLRRFELTRP